MRWSLVVWDDHCKHYSIVAIPETTWKEKGGTKRHNNQPLWLLRPVALIYVSPSHVHRQWTPWVRSHTSAGFINLRPPAHTAAICSRDMNQFLQAWGRGKTVAGLLIAANKLLPRVKVWEGEWGCGYKKPKWVSFALFLGSGPVPKKEPPGIPVSSLPLSLAGVWFLLLRFRGSKFKGCCML